MHDYAFRMGRPKHIPAVEHGSVGVYGIGMKRAVFKMGRRALISTQHRRQSYEVEVTPEWMDNDAGWSLPVRAAKKPAAQDGTTIVIGELYGGISQRFSADAHAFKSDLERLISTHYAFIIDKGFSVKVNKDVVKPRPTQLIFAKSKDQRRGNLIQPYIFRTETPDGVKVFLAVGFTRPIPSEEEAANATEETKYSSLDAGWTVLCNDRAVLYCDRSELTGWGEAGVPRYHNQFIAISGIVDFRSDDLSKLPTTTTKRGIDASSSLYLQIKNKMREGMSLFTDYTNKWKGRADESRKQIDAGTPLSFEQIKAEAKNLKFKTLKKSVPRGEQYKPSLPLPPTLASSKRRIAFTKSDSEVRQVGDFLFDDPERDPSVVGERCFDLMLKEARR
ncbi:MAG: ATP-binding protein [Candidatus Binataceae bacterium]